MIVETEAERRYEIDQVIANARLSGGGPSAGVLAIMERFVRGEITAHDMGLQIDAFTASTDYDAIAGQVAVNKASTP